MNRSFGWVCWSGGSTRLFDVISGVVVQEYLVVAVVVPLQMNWSFWLICWSGGTTGLFGVIGGVVVQDYWVVVVQLQMNRSFRIAEVMVIRTGLFSGWSWDCLRIIMVLQVTFIQIKYFKSLISKKRIGSPTIIALQIDYKFFIKTSLKFITYWK